MDSQRVRASHADHSLFVEPCYPALLSASAKLETARPRLAFYSTVRGGLANNRLGPEHWAAHALLPVLFYPAVRAAVEDGLTVFLELGMPMLVKMGIDCCRDISDSLVWHAVLGNSIAEDVQAFACAVEIGKLGSCHSSDPMVVVGQSALGALD